MDFQTNFQSNSILHAQKPPFDGMKQPNSEPLDQGPSALIRSKKVHPNGKLNALLEAHYQSLAKPKRPLLPNNPNSNTSKSTVLNQEKNYPPINNNITLPYASNSTVKDSPGFRRTRNINSELKPKEGSPISLIKAYLESGYINSTKNDYEKALIITTQAKNTLEKSIQKNWKFDFEIMLQLFHNLIAFTYK